MAADRPNGVAATTSPMKPAHSLAEITPEGLGFMGNMLRRQGLKLEKAKKKRAKKE
jgi:hypothetical protein